MCRTMNELEKVVADYRGLKALKETVNTFVIENGNGNQVRLGKSSIMQPKVQFKGKGIKWFDDSKLIRKKEN